MRIFEPFEFERQYAEFSHSVFRFCHRLTANRAEAEDLTQDVFVAAWTGKERFKQESSVRTWLFRIAVYKVREWQRKQKRFVVLTSEPSVSDPGVEYELDLYKQLDNMPEKLKIAFILVKLEQFTSLDAAKILGIPEGTVKFQVHSAIQHLRAVLTDPRSNDNPSNKPQEKIPYAM